MRVLCNNDDNVDYNEGQNTDVDNVTVMMKVKIVMMKTMKKKTVMKKIVMMIVMRRQ